MYQRIAALGDVTSEAYLVGTSECASAEGAFAAGARPDFLRDVDNFAAFLRQQQITAYHVEAGRRCCVPLSPNLSFSRWGHLASNLSDVTLGAAKTRLNAGASSNIQGTSFDAEATTTKRY